MLATSVAFATACTGDIAEPQGPSSDTTVLAHESGSTIAALSLGAMGPDVVALQEYLTQYGYFPNDALAETFTDWVSVSAISPEGGIFDETTEDAVREFQTRNGLEATGIVGPETRHVMSQGRCGNPDSYEHDDDSKFAIMLQKWKASKRNFTWKAIDPSQCRRWDQTANWGRGDWVACFGSSRPAPATRQQLRDIANFAFAMWGLETDITFTESTASTVDITFQWSEIHQRTSGESARLGVRASPSSLAVTVSSFTSSQELVRGDVHFNQAQPLSPANSTPAANFDMYAIAVHEVGHALGLLHSNTPYGVVPVMKPAINAGPGELRTLSFDDANAISSRYDKWNTRPGLATDMAAGADGSIWHIGTAATGDGFRIYKWNNTIRDWQEASGNGGATRIAIQSNGNPWVVTRTGAVFFHSANHAEGGWNHVAGLCATDIGAGGDGSLWFVTCTPDYEGPEGGFKVGKLVIVPVGWDSAVIGIQEVPGPTHASRISVGKRGHPHIVNTLGDVYWGSTDPAVRSWNGVPGIKAADIAMSPNDIPYATGAAGNAGRLYIYNYQPALGDQAPARNEWYELARLPTGTPSVIAAGYRTAWATNTSLAIFQQTEKFLF